MYEITETMSNLVTCLSTKNNTFKDLIFNFHLRSSTFGLVNQHKNLDDLHCPDAGVSIPGEAQQRAQPTFGGRFSQRQLDMLSPIKIGQSVDKNHFRLYSMMSKWNNDLAFEMRLLRS